MKQSIGNVSLVVRDYDEAIDFYVNTLGFTLVEDTKIEEQNKRWVLVAPRVHRITAVARASGWRGSVFASRNLLQLNQQLRPVP